MDTLVVYVEPLADTVWKAVVTLIQYVAEVTLPLRNWIQTNVPAYIDMVSVYFLSLTSYLFPLLPAC